MADNTRLTTVWITTRFQAVHRWPDAPDGSLLKSYHRHEFHVKLEVVVGGPDREVEFLDLKDRVNAFIEQTMWNEYTDDSCETMARKLMDEFGAHSVTVSEDGENGATVTDTEALVAAVRNAPPTFMTTAANPVPPGSAYTTAGGVPPSKDFEGHAAEMNRYVVAERVTVPVWVKVGRPTDQVRSSSSECEYGTPVDRPADKVWDACFVGREVEGPRPGVLTLFVPGPVSPATFAIAWNKVKGQVGAVYYGAGNQRQFQPETFSVITRLTGDLPVTVEVDRLDRAVLDAVTGTRAEVVSMASQDAGLAHYAKTVTSNEVIWQARDGTTYSASLDHRWYAQDEEV